jgi:hypothetical protein
MRALLIEDLAAVVERHTNKLYKKKNVVGVGTGLKHKNGKSTGEMAILIFVSKKEHPDRLRRHDLIESELDGIKTDVVGKVGQLKIQNIVAQARAVNSKLERPVHVGTSISHLYVTAGTLGGFFLDKDDEVVILSNQHVIAGDPMKGPYGKAPKKGNVTIQPGTYDGGTIKNTIGHLKAWVPLKKRDNTEDSAISKIDDVSQIVNEIKGLGKINGFEKARIGQAVHKVGRSTGHTNGKIISVNTSICVDYSGLIRCFNNCIVTTQMSAGGDSGSVLLNKNMNAVGLLFAGSDTVTIYNPIFYPVKTYGLKIWK